MKSGISTFDVGFFFRGILNCSFSHSLAVDSLPLGRMGFPVYLMNTIKIYALFGLLTSYSWQISTNLK